MFIYSRAIMLASFFCVVHSAQSLHASDVNWKTRISQMICNCNRWMQSRLVPKDISDINLRTIFNLQYGYIFRRPEPLIIVLAQVPPRKTPQIGQKPSIIGRQPKVEKKGSTAQPSTQTAPAPVKPTVTPIADRNIDYDQWKPGKVDK